MTANRAPGRCRAVKGTETLDKPYTRDVVRCGKEDGHAGRHAESGRPRALSRYFKTGWVEDEWHLPGLYVAIWTEPMWGSVTGMRGIRQIHSSFQCRNDKTCVLHDPSDHSMRTWPAIMRADKDLLVERQCPHGVGHPDPDSVAFLDSRGPRGNRGVYSIHGCDGCCS